MTGAGPRFESPKSLVEHIKEYIKEMIVRNEFKPGQQLVEIELEKILNVSRTPIREAFRVLEKDGFIQSIPRRGVFVRKLTRKDVEDNWFLRAHLEGIAAKLAVSNMSPQDLAFMKEATVGMTSAANEKDFENYVKWHDTFHQIFIQACGNSSLIAMVTNLRKHAFWHRLNYLYFSNVYHEVTEVHKQILELFKLGEQGKVEMLVREHILLSMNKFIDLIPEESEGLETQV